MSDSYLPPFSGAAPHPPGYVCGDLCTPWCAEGARPAAPAAAVTAFESLAVPAPRDVPDRATAPS